MTADDFFLLFIAFGGFVIAPALGLWSFVRIADADVRPDVDSPDASIGDGRKGAARSGRANEFLRCLAGWTDTARRRVERLDGAADTKA